MSLALSRYLKQSTSQFTIPINLETWRNIQIYIPQMGAKHEKREEVGNRGRVVYGIGNSSISQGFWVSSYGVWENVSLSLSLVSHQSVT
jgi:hypothetical protein